MKKYTIFILFALMIIVLGIIFFSILNNRNIMKKNNVDINNIEIERSNIEKEIMGKKIKNNIRKDIDEDIAFSETPILEKDKDRINNINITANGINEKIIKPGETFSFNETVGNPTPEKGYKKAGIIVKGKKEKGYGGGNCQVSSTLYDAASKVDGLEIIERHEHGKNVGYIEKGKDATVVYDELDLKIKNNTQNSIKISILVESDKVIVKLIKIT